MAVKGLSPALLPDARVVSSLRNSHWLEFIFGSGKSLVLTVALRLTKAISTLICV